MLKYHLDERVYFTNRKFVEIEASTNKNNAFEVFLSQALTFGTNSSLYSGRGYIYAEHRQYQQGDDVRFIDWKLTHRTNTPYVRTYNEERALTVCLCVDQRSNMFFSSQNIMKSVVAVEIAAHLGWSAIRSNLKVSLLSFSPNRIYFNKPSNSESELVTQFKELILINNELSSSSVDSLSFDNVIEYIKNEKFRDAVYIVISDWLFLNDDVKSGLNDISENNDLILVSVRDPLDNELPNNIIKSNVVFSDGKNNILIDNKEKFNLFNENLQANKALLNDFVNSCCLNVFNFDTSGMHGEKIKMLLSSKE